MCSKPTADTLNACLPQTQCGLCEFDGCKPYAEAIATQGEPIDKCLPGGVDVLKQLAALTHTNPAPLMASMQQRMRHPQIALIDETTCIGCTKCIQACPVDAIIGTAKQMHTIVTNECTGCELCIEPCPVDCITLQPLAAPAFEKTKALQRYQQKNQRQQLRQKEKQARYREQVQAKATPATAADIAQKRKAIEAALARVKQKQSSSQIRNWQHDTETL